MCKFYKPTAFVNYKIKIRRTHNVTCYMLKFKKNKNVI